MADTQVLATIVGAGFAGMYTLHRMREAGFMPASSKQAITLAEPGTGIVIPAPGATWKAWSTLFL